ncbi:MAG: PadR family transcriptional regulator [Acidobacteria bacterium]|nr:PadR family transcriptional regulator [Acidobacteriota bacterium]
MRLGDEAYALPIRAQLAEVGRSVSRGALYTTLMRLEKKGFVESRIGDPLPQRSGRARRYFRVSAAGIAAVRSSREVLLRVWGGLEDKLENP